MAGATETPAAQLAIARQLALNAQGASATSAPMLDAGLAFSVQIAGATETGDAALDVWRAVAAHCAGASTVADATLFTAGVLYMQAQFAAASVVADAELRNQIVTGLLVVWAAVWAGGMTATGAAAAMTATGRNVAPTATGRARDVSGVRKLPRAFAGYVLIACRQRCQELSVLRTR